MNRSLRVFDYIGRQWKIVAIISATAVGNLALGVFLGSYLSCGGGECNFRVSLFEAIGTWFGGLGTIAALVVAILAFSGEERTKRQRAEQEQRDADAVKLSARVLLTDGDGDVVCVVVEVKNGSSTTALTNLRGEVDGWGVIDPCAALEPGGVHVTTFQYVQGVTSPYANLPFRQDQEIEKLREIKNGTAIRFGMHARDWKKVEGSDFATQDV